MGDEAFRRLPAVHSLVDAVTSGPGSPPRWAVVTAARQLLDERRGEIAAGGSAATVEPAEVAALAQRLATRPLRRVINATGVILHTNLGRAPLAAEALAAIGDAAGGYSNLEYDLDGGERGSRHDHLARLLRDLTGAEAALVVNNNAAAVVLALAATASNRQVIVSRGELIEIGGSFRLPEILAMSGCRLVEVGTTNKTRLADYERAIGNDTAAILKVHRSNFAIVGFTEETSVAELDQLARRCGLPVIGDLGSGSLLDPADLGALGLPAEPSVGQWVKQGLDLVCFSGDKLLGGPQAGIIVGKADAVARCRAHPLMRALRPDKLTIAALGATLVHYRRGQWRSLPVHAMVAASRDDLLARVNRLVAAARPQLAAGLTIEVVPCESTLGGGALPTTSLPSWGLALGGAPMAVFDQQLRAAPVPIIGRVVDHRLLLDLRTVAPGDDETVALVLAHLVLPSGRASG